MSDIFTILLTLALGVTTSYTLGGSFYLCWRSHPVIRIQGASL
jgi:hypothetical protein